MFSGIIKAVARVKKSESSNEILSLTISKPRGWNLKAGDSVAADGVCLTVKKAMKDSYVVDLMSETLRKTTFGKAIPKLVNLERPLRLSDFLDGHIVQGHVDAVGSVSSIERHGDSKEFTISYPKEFSHLLVSKGSVTVNGVSLTVVEVLSNRFSVSLIPYTLTHTTFSELNVHDYVNLEFDIIAKHLYRFIAIKKENRLVR